MKAIETKRKINVIAFGVIVNGLMLLSLLIEFYNN